MNEGTEFIKRFDLKSTINSPLFTSYQQGNGDSDLRLYYKKY